MLLHFDHRRRRHNFQKSRYGIWPSRKTERPESIEKSIRKKMMELLHTK